MYECSGDPYVSGRPTRYPPRRVGEGLMIRLPLGGRSAERPYRRGDSPGRSELIADDGERLRGDAEVDEASVDGEPRNQQGASQTTSVVSSGFWTRRLVAARARRVARAARFQARCANSAPFARNRSIHLGTTCSGGTLGTICPPQKTHWRMSLPSS
jgi:hypothetical protein